MRYKYFIILLVFVMAADKAYSMNTKKYLELQINSESVSGFIKMNDIIVFDDINGAPVNHKQPVNHWAVNGENNISIAILLKRDEDRPDDIFTALQNQQIKVTLTLRVEGDDSSNTYTLSQFSLAPSKETPKILGSSSIHKLRLSSKDSYKVSEDGDVIIGEYIQSSPNKDWIAFDMDFTIENVGIQKWAYLTGDVIDIKDLPDEEFFAIADDLYLKYKELWTLFNAKDLDKLLKLIELRASEYDAAYHLPLGSKLKEMRRSLESAFEHEDLYLSDIVPTENANMFVMANGRVAKLEVAGAGEPLIYYSHKRGSFTRFYDFYFMRKDGEWVIIR